MSEGADKVVEASPEKRQRAKTQGDVSISNEANTVAALLGLLIGIPFVQARLSGLAKDVSLYFIDPENAAQQLFENGRSSTIMFDTYMVILPILFFPAIMVILSLALQQSIVWAPSRIKPQIKKIDPVAGVGRKFGPQAMVEFLRLASKVVLLSLVGGWILFGEAARVALGFDLTVPSLLDEAKRQLLVFLGLALALSVVFALVDIPIVRFQREKRLKMTDQEQRDEVKEREGDTQIKSQRRRRAEKIAMTRMMSETKKADVVITNPTHYAVALKWKRDGTELPKCVAKGTEELALRIRQIAHQENIPIHEDPPAARSLYATIDVGEPIEQQHFAAVAAAIRFADRVRMKKRYSAD